MERMTHINYLGWYVNGPDSERLRGPHIDRLAAYEDTGFDPAEIKKVFNEESILKLAAQFLGTTPDRFRELVQAENAGLLVALPCKVGTKVWVIFSDRIRETRVQGISITNSGEVCLHFGGYPAFYEFASDFGKTVFSTREEAEAALEAQKGKKP